MAGVDIGESDGKTGRRWARFPDGLDDRIDVASVVEDFIHLLVLADQRADPLSFGVVRTKRLPLKDVSRRCSRER